MGEEGEEQGAEKEAVFCGPVAPVHIDKVARRHEKVEGDPGGEDQIQGGGGEGEARRVQHPLRQREGKVQVLEEEERPEQKCQQQRQQGFPARSIPALQQPGSGYR